MRGASSARAVGESIQPTITGQQPPPRAAGPITMALSERMV